MHLTLSHLCLILIVPFVIRANIERLAYSSIYVFNRPSSSVGRDFVDSVLNMGGSGEGDGGGTGNDAAPWSSCAMWYICVVKQWLLCIFVKTIWIVVVIYMSWTWIVIVLLSVCALFWWLPIQGSNQNWGYIKNPIYSSVNRGTYDLIFIG
jgi:hypothetical protein